MAIQFKTDRQKEEWFQLQSKNYKLYRLVKALNEFTELEFNKDILLTEVFRTQAEFDSLYTQTPIEQRPKTSPHLNWGAVDLRSSIYSDREIQRLLSFLNVFTYFGGQRKVALYHTIAGNTMHFHIQYGLDA